MKKELLVVAVFLLTLTGFARTFICDYPMQASNAINAALPGDTILLADKTWGISQLPNRDGTLDSPIVVKALNPVIRKIDSSAAGLWNHPDAYGVIFNTSNSDEGVRFKGKHWIFEDIFFQANLASPHNFHIPPGAKGYNTWRGCCFSGATDKAFKIDYSAVDQELFPTWDEVYWPDYMLFENCVVILGCAGFINNDGADFLTMRNCLLYGLTSSGSNNYTNFSKGGLAYTIFENNVQFGGHPIGALSFGGGTWGGSTYRHDLDLCLGLPSETYETVNSIIRNNVVIGAPAGIHTTTSLNCEAYNNTLVNCTHPLSVETHQGIPVGFQFYNNLMIGCGTLTQSYGTLSNNKVLAATDTTIFQKFLLSQPPAAGRFNDYRIKPDSAVRVGTGRSLIAHLDWPAFYGLPTTEFYDMYGKVRGNPPIIGAAELYDGTELSVQETPEFAENSAVAQMAICPNPANPSTELVFDLMANQPLVDVLIRDINGRYVRSLYYGPMTQGRHSVHWDGRNHHREVMASGVYFFRVSFGRDVVYRQFQLIR